MKESYLSAAFAAHGDRIARYPLAFIVPVVIFSACLSAGLSKVTVDEVRGVLSSKGCVTMRTLHCARLRVVAHW